MITGAMGGEARYIGLENFVRLFTRDSQYWDAVVNTLVYVGES